MHTINLENYNGALINSQKILLKCSYIVSLLLHPTLFQNVVIYNFDKTFSIEQTLFTLTFLELLLQIVLLVGFPPFPVGLYFSKSNFSVGSVLLEQVTMLSSLMIIV